MDSITKLDFPLLFIRNEYKWKLRAYNILGLELLGQQLLDSGLIDAYKLFLEDGTSIFKSNNFVEV